MTETTITYKTPWSRPQTISLADYERAKGLVGDMEAGDLTGFAEACYDQNSVTELCNALERQTADQGDCNAWDLTAAEWRTAIREALAAKIADIDEYRA